MQPQSSDGTAADFRYVDADRVQFAGGALSGFRACTEDAEPLGIVEGIVVNPASRRVAYLVLASPGLLRIRRHLLPLQVETVMQLERKLVLVGARRDQLHLQTFEPRSIPGMTEEDVRAAERAQSAA